MFFHQCYFWWFVLWLSLCCASHHLFLQKLSENWAVSLTVIDYLRLLFVSAFVWVSSQLLSNLGVQDHVKRRHLKRMCFFNHVIMLSMIEKSLKMFEQMVFTF